MLGAPSRGRAGLAFVTSILRSATADAAAARFVRGVVTDAVRRRLDEIRRSLDDDVYPPSAEQILDDVIEGLARTHRPGIRPVISATGVVLHTNLGRAPLSDEAIAAVRDACGYATVELDLESGERSARTARASGLAAELCGAEAATVVNNGAAALLLAVAALAHGREVIVSRGELVEIGGEFRLPDIIAMSGARLVEVGTTNRTRIEDYATAVSSETALLLKVHRSNFRMVGFTAEVGLPDLVRLGVEIGVPTVLDAGSGLIGNGLPGLPTGEPSIAAAVRSGADLVLFSGDKVLGGPQAGIIVGRPDAVDRCRRSPLARALRLNKLQLAAIEATLLAHVRDPHGPDVPVAEMLGQGMDRLRERAGSIIDRLEWEAPTSIEVLEVDGVVGAGAAPGAPVASIGLAVTGHDAARLARRLRAQEPPIVARVEGDRVILDLRTVRADQDIHVVGALRRALDHSRDRIEREAE